MRKSYRSLALTSLLVAKVALAAAAAAKKDDDVAPPPPPPPPPAETTETKESDAPTSSSFKHPDALLDASTGKHRPMMLSFFAGIPYGSYYFCYSCGGFPIGVSARFNLPIVHDGFVPQINDSFDIEGGIDLNFFPGSAYGAFQFALMVAPRYTVYLLPKLMAFAKIELGFGIHPTSGVYGIFDPIVALQVGIVYKITDAIYLRAEIGTYALKGGIGIAF